MITAQDKLNRAIEVAVSFARARDTELPVFELQTPTSGIVRVPAGMRVISSTNMSTLGVTDPKIVMHASMMRDSTCRIELWAADGTEIEVWFIYTVLASTVILSDTQVNVTVPKGEE